MIINLHGKLETSLQGRENLPKIGIPPKPSALALHLHPRNLDTTARSTLEQGLVISCPLFSFSLSLFNSSLFPSSLSPYPLIQNPLLILGGLGLTHQLPCQVCSLLKRLRKLLQEPLTHIIPFDHKHLQILGAPFLLREEHHSKEPLIFGGNWDETGICCFLPHQHRI